MGVPSTAEGRYYVVAPAGTTTLQEVAGRIGDELDWLWIAAGAGTVTLRDGGTPLWSWDALATDRFVPLNIRSRIGAWSIVTTGGVTAMAAGDFS